MDSPMEHTDRVPIIVERTPIRPKNPIPRRNAKENPEYLDTETLMEKFEPLLNSLHRKFSAFHGAFPTSEDKQELRQQIDLEFLRLRAEYDPTRGVEFAGFISFHLQQRVYHYVTQQMKLRNHEVSDSDFTSSDSTEDDGRIVVMDNDSALVDQDAAHRMWKVEALASVPWDKLSETQACIVRGLTQEHKSLQDIASDLHMSSLKMTQEFNALLTLLIRLHAQGD